MQESWEAARRESPEKFGSVEAKGGRPVCGGGGRFGQGSPWDEAPLLSRLSFFFVRPLLRTWRTEAPTAASLPRVPSRDDPQVVALRVSRAWRLEVARSRKRSEDRRYVEATFGAGSAECARLPAPRAPSLVRALLRCFLPELGDLGAWMALEYGCLFAQAALVGPLVEWLDESQRPTWEGWALGAALAAVSLLQAASRDRAAKGRELSFSFARPSFVRSFAAGTAPGSSTQVAHHAAFYVGMRGGWNARVAMIRVVHEALLEVSSAEVRRLGTGYVFSLVNSDVMRFDAASRPARSLKGGTSKDPGPPPR